LERLRDLAGITLDPLGEPDTGDPALEYPHKLPLSTLQGYFGEVFAGLIVENGSALGESGWQVPAFLFRTHAVAFEQLELMRQTGQPLKGVPGRTGDDCMAFRRDSQGNIIRTLYCEAKCTLGHDTSLIADAHER
jgi:hypothetical protein